MMLIEICLIICTVIVIAGYFQKCKTTPERDHDMVSCAYEHIGTIENSLYRGELCLVVTGGSEVRTPVAIFRYNSDGEVEFAQFGPDSGLDSYLETKGKYHETI